MLKKINLIIIFIILAVLISSCTDFLVEDPINNDPIDIIPDEISDQLDFLSFFNDEIKKDITIEITEDEWDGLNQEMNTYHEQFGNYRTDVYAKAKMYFSSDLTDSPLVIENIGFRSKGNTSRVILEDSEGNLNKSHFKISFHEDFDQDAYQIYDERTIFDVEELELKYNRNYDSTYINEKFSFDLFNDFGVVSPQATLSNLYIKIGDQTYYYGLYTVFEPVDKLFLEKRFDENNRDGDLYKSLWQGFQPASLQNNYVEGEMGIKDESINYRPTYDLKNNKKTSNHEALIKFIDDINTWTDLEFESWIETIFDVDNFLRLLALGVLIGNPDDYRAMANNYYLYQEETSLLWHMIPYDYDHSFGIGWNPSENYTIDKDIEEWFNINAEILGVDTYAHPLSDRILSNEIYLNQYKDYIRELIDPQNGLFRYERYESAYLQAKSLYEDDVNSDSEFYQIEFGLRDIEDYFTQKTEQVNNQINE
jgi:spore coat protein CotH